jgi:hypothetical protein
MFDVSAEGKIVSYNYSFNGYRLIVVVTTISIWDISVLNRLSAMNRQQAQEICRILHVSSSSSEKRNQCWEEICNVFEEEEDLTVKSKECCTLQ